MILLVASFVIPSEAAAAAESRDLSIHSSSNKLRDCHALRARNDN